MRASAEVLGHGRLGAVRLLYDRSDPTMTGEISNDRLVELYRYRLPQTSAAVVRTNFISSLDGSVQGPNGRSGSISTPSDHHVFAVQRALADVILVGAGTVRKEGYRAVDLATWQRDIRASEGLSPFPASPWLARHSILTRASRPHEAGLGVLSRSSPLLARMGTILIVFVR